MGSKRPHGGLLMDGGDHQPVKLTAHAPATKAEQTVQIDRWVLPDTLFCPFGIISLIKLGNFERPNAANKNVRTIVLRQSNKTLNSGFNRVVKLIVKHIPNLVLTAKPY